MMGEREYRTFFLVVSVLSAGCIVIAAIGYIVYAAFCR